MLKTCDLLVLLYGIESHDTLNTMPEETQKEEVFDITIKNGAGQLLRQLMDHYSIDNAKDLIALSLSLLNRVKGSNITIEKPDGSSVRLTIGSDDNASKPK